MLTSGSTGDSAPGTRPPARTAAEWVDHYFVAASAFDAPRTIERETMLKTLGAYAAVTGGIAAPIGVVFALRQLALQARAAKLSVLVVINEGWKKRKEIALDRTDRDRWTSETPLSLDAAAVVTRALGASEASPVAVTSAPLLDPVPFALLLLAPQWSGGANPAIARDEDRHVRHSSLQVVALGSEAPQIFSYGRRARPRLDHSGNLRSVRSPLFCPATHGQAWMVRRRPGEAAALATSECGRGMHPFRPRT